jgi:NAD(P)-dependent dehydrogenase (short-subunit alcohol dehydrogenase family)
VGSDTGRVNVVASADPLQARGVAAVSGAAGAIGRATVAKLVSRGNLVVAVDRDAAALEQLTRHHGSWIVPVHGELPSEATVAAVGDALTELGALHHVIAIAGGATGDEIVPTSEDLTVHAFRASVEANLIGTWAFTNTCIRHLKSTSGNRSITFCSTRNAFAGHGLPAYSAAKAGLHGLLHPLAVELGAHGIRVNAVAPGQIATPFARRYHADQPGHFERIAAASSLGRLATEDDVADAFVAMALDLTAVTGQTLLVDAGAHIWRNA